MLPNVTEFYIIFNKRIDNCFSMWNGFEIRVKYREVKKRSKIGKWSKYMHIYRCIYMDRTDAYDIWLRFPTPTINCPIANTSSPYTNLVQWIGIKKTVKFSYPTETTQMASNDAILIELKKYISKFYNSQNELYKFDI